MATCSSGGRGEMRHQNMPTGVRREKGSPVILKRLVIFESTNAMFHHELHTWGF